MTYPIYRQDFEGGTTLATACPELIDFDGKYAIDTSGSNALTGTHALSSTEHTSGWDIFSSAADTLGGNITFTAYFKGGTTAVYPSLFVRLRPAGNDSPTDYLRAQFISSTPQGLLIKQSVTGTVTTLNTPLTTSVGLAIGHWYCLEIRCNGTAISARLIDQSTGQFWVQSGSGSWSSTASQVAGTATAAAAAGSYGFSGGDNTSLYVDDWFLGPAVPSIDLPTFTIGTIGGTQQLTAGGFTDPLFGVTWLSSNTGVATVGATTGLVTSVAAGSATITATGKRDTGQTATATATVATGATTYTLTAPTPASGYVHNNSGQFTVTPNNTYTGTITLTPSGTGLTTPQTLTFSGTSAPQTASFVPQSAGTMTVTGTNSGTLSNPAAVTYTANAQTLAVSPTSCSASGSTTLTFTGAGTLWTQNVPTFTASGVAGASCGTATVTTNTQATVTLTTGAATGTLTITDSTSGATCTVTITAAAAATAYTLTAPTPASGYVNNASGNYSITPNNTYTGSITITPSGGGLSTPIVKNWSASSITQTFTVTPLSAGTVTLTGTNSGTLSNPAAVTYTANAQTLAVSPTSSLISSSTPITLTGGGTTWATTAPTFTVSGVAGASLGSVAVTSSTQATATLTTGTTAGTLTITDSTTAAQATMTVTPPIQAWPYRSHAVGFAAGLSTMGYTVINSSDNSTYAARSQAGILDHGHGTYSAAVAVPIAGAHIVRWDDGANFADDILSPFGVEPASGSYPGGINIYQALSLILAFAAGKSSGFDSTQPTNNVAFVSPNGMSRIAGTVDNQGNRTTTTLTLP